MFSDTFAPCTNLLHTNKRYTIFCAKRLRMSTCKVEIDFKSGRVFVSCNLCRKYILFS